eukprot:scaffold32505_cov118-Isochrysis_galbana.AAC.2
MRKAQVGAVRTHRLGRTLVPDESSSTPCAAAAMAAASSSSERPSRRIRLNELTSAKLTKPSGPWAMCPCRNESRD